MTTKKLPKKIYIINRQTGNTDYVVETYEQYKTMYNYFLTMNDVKQAVKVFADIWNESQSKFLKDFDLIELVNCFSNNYLAKRGRI